MTRGFFLLVYAWATAAGNPRNMSKLALIPLALCMASCAGAPSVPQAPSGLAVTPAVAPVVSPAPVPARLSGLDLDGFDRSGLGKGIVRLHRGGGDDATADRLGRCAGEVDG